MSEVGGGEIAPGIVVEESQDLKPVEELLFQDLKRGDLFVVTTGRQPEVSKGNYTVRVIGLRKEGILVMVHEDQYTGGRKDVDTYRARLVGGGIKLSSLDEGSVLEFKGLKHLSGERAGLITGGKRVGGIQNIEVVSGSSLRS